MRHFADSAFWRAYDKLPVHVRAAADRSFAVLKQDPRHPSLYFKKIGKYRSVRIGLGYRALAVETEEDCIWFWIGSHAEYDKLVSSH